MIDAIKARGSPNVCIVWSGLPSVKTLSSGKYPNSTQFESKAQIAVYGRASGVPFVDVQAGGHTGDFLTTKRPRRVSEGEDVWAFASPMPPSAVLPLIDAVRDYGLFVRKAIEAKVFPAGETWGAWGEYLTLEEQFKQLSEVTGRKVVYKQISGDEFEARLKAGGVPESVLPSMREMFLGIGEFGYFVNGTVLSHEGLAEKPRTWREFVEAQDWSGVFV
ncbi:NmrA domain-containing protein [Mycena chlorophos]|uniref:NmrA domain-containing protein n=1 Tax=Mycena chlorophos TaxID=658473 RepID=A0A8H6TMT2_MYCCL|nr:NmrA domain-containing protein [Mycena chlorophos]